MSDLIRKYALHNAVKHNGTANASAVIGKIIAEDPELKKEIKTLIPRIKEIVAQVNSLSLEEQQKSLETLAPELLAKRKQERVYGLPELSFPVGKEGSAPPEVVMRFAPGPSGPLHIGHSRAAILNDEYTRKYEGKLIIRLEDTNPLKVDPEAYNMILEDLDRSWTLLAPSAQVTVLGERTKIPPWGLNGGEPGAPAVYQIRRQDGTLEKLKSKTALKLNEGDTLIIETAGGGGYGVSD